MAARNPWRDFYNSALRQPRNGLFRVLLADVAVSVCVQWLLEISRAARSLGPEEILMAIEILEFSNRYAENRLKRLPRFSHFGEPGLFLRVFLSGLDSGR